MLGSLFYFILSYICLTNASNYCKRNSENNRFPYELKTAKNSIDGTPLYSRFIEPTEYVGKALNSIVFTMPGMEVFILQGLNLLKEMLKSMPLGKIVIPISSLGITLNLNNLQIEQFDFPHVYFKNPETGKEGYGVAYDASMKIVTDYTIRSSSFIGKMFEDQGSLEFNIKNLDIALYAAVYLAGEYKYSTEGLGERYCPYHFLFRPTDNVVVKIGEMNINFIASSNKLVSSIVSALISMVKTVLESTFGSLFFDSLISIFADGLADEMTIRNYVTDRTAFDGRFNTLEFKKYNFIVTQGGYIFDSKRTESAEIFDFDYPTTPHTVDRFRDFYKVPENELNKMDFHDNCSLADFAIVTKGRHLVNSLFRTMHTVYDSLWNGDWPQEGTFSRTKGVQTDGVNVLTRLYFNFSYTSPDGRVIKTDDYKDLFLINPEDDYNFSFVREYMPTSYYEKIPATATVFSYDFKIPKDVNSAPYVKKVGPSALLATAEDITITVSARKTHDKADYEPLYSIKTDVYFTLNPDFRCDNFDSSILTDRQYRPGYFFFTYNYYNINPSKTKIFDLDGNEIMLNDYQIKKLRQHIKSLMVNIAAPYYSYMNNLKRSRGEGMNPGLASIGITSIPIFDFPRGDTYIMVFDPVHENMSLELNFRDEMRRI